ncbi:TPA: autotransporter outer membrane beta-barrel domain-containing protein [Legionella pneumophila]|uniref:autotransporter outer membrane beta-barrel domain-containing protein n=1 Tax=Legionella pneumophila TaxID=446 RepID=UPI0004807E33|nr:autotransporter outer membrane beta-barrel domain-containing protein [Legionella pneumophila]ANH13094.1 hypothetical protein A5478_08625 [Legionella pneumophila]ANH16061.1 hypothetical protein A5480_08620 [Legionella pneumophila]ANH19027.1 hypothetical protein A5479_08620 [Legionella pneumophila]APX19915.1 hypothetical protein A1D14_08635 [Legionella pneumophila]AQL12091.1 hypothetical protein A1D13_08635 [Legionella pneumophila]
MKIKFLLSMIGVILSTQSAYAKIPDSSASKTQNINDNKSAKNTNNFLKKITPEFAYSYIDFNFDSTAGLNFNRYNGHSNLYSIGADHFSPVPSIIAGLYVLNIDTEVSSQFQLFPNTPIPSNQTIHNNTLFAHMRKIFTPKFDIDIAGGYGQNRINSQTLLNRAIADIAFSKHTNDNWLASINAVYRKRGKKISLRTYVGMLYSQINSGSYILAFQSNQRGQIIAPLTTKTTYIMEGTEISYKLNSTLTPFVNGGLIQIADFTNSRPILTQQINGSLPQLNMDKNGYKLGAGLIFNYKQMTLRLEEKYYSAGNIFESYQTTAGLEYRFN